MRWVNETVEGTIRCTWAAILMATMCLFVRLIGQAEQKCIASMNSRRETFPVLRSVS
jgi:hypothetical protein